MTKSSETSILHFYASIAWGSCECSLAESSLTAARWCLDCARESVSRGVDELSLSLLRAGDFVMKTRNYESQLVRNSAMGKNCRHPDAFLEQFGYLPVNVLEKVLSFMPAKEIPRLQGVCSSWRDLIKRRRRFLPKVFIQALTVHFNERIQMVADTDNRDVLGILGSAWRHVYTTDVDSVHSHHAIGALDLHVTHLSEAISQLHLSDLDLASLTIHFYREFGAEDAELASRLVAAAKANPRIRHVDVRFYSPCTEASSRLLAPLLASGKSLKLGAKVGLLAVDMQPLMGALGEGPVPERLHFENCALSTEDVVAAVKSWKKKALSSCRITLSGCPGVDLKTLASALEQPTTSPLRVRSGDSLMEVTLL